MRQCNWYAGNWFAGNWFAGNWFAGNWFAGLLIVGFALGCGSDAKPGGNSAAPKFEGEAADGAAAATGPSATDESASADAAMPDATENENAKADEAEMKDGEATAAEKPDASDTAAAEEAPVEPKSEGEKTARPAAKASSGGIFKGLTNSVLRGAQKTLNGSAKPSMSGPPAEPKAEDDPFPNGEPSDKPADNN
jgi:hypothetical protein